MALLRAKRALSLQRSRVPDYHEPSERAEVEQVEYACPRGHEFVIPLLLGRDYTPPTWTCPQHGAEADLVVSQENPGPRSRKPRPLKQHWEQLCGRRSIADLEALLDERLAELRARRATGDETDPARDVRD